LRHDLLLATWGDGSDPGTRAHGESERDWVSRLVWGVLEMPDGDAQALAMPLPDALRLSDAMTAWLRARVGADEDEVRLRDRVRELQTDLDRVRGELVEDGGGEDGLEERLDAVEETLQSLRGREDPDVLTEIGDAGLEVASVDRAIVVGRVAQAHDRADRAQAESERDHLVARGQAVRSLAEK